MCGPMCSLAADGMCRGRVASCLAMHMSRKSLPQFSLFLQPCDSGAGLLYDKLMDVELRSEAQAGGKFNV